MRRKLTEGRPLGADAFSNVLKDEMVDVDQVV